MFSSIEPYAPRRCYLPGNLFPALCTTNTYSYHPLFLPANEKIAYTCSQTASQSALCSLPLYSLTLAPSTGLACARQLSGPGQHLSPLPFSHLNGVLFIVRDINMNAKKCGLP